MTASVDVAQQHAHVRLIQADPVVEAGVRILRDDVEGNRATGAHVYVHDQVIRALGIAGSRSHIASVGSALSLALTMQSA